jgi:DNA ligase (NAD+)
MNKIEAKQRIEKLKKEINYHRYLYHVLDKQEISDEALDSLKNELFLLENQYPELITSDSPSQRIGGKPLNKFEKYTHKYPMLSFFDAFSEKEMEDWEKRYTRFLDNNLGGGFDKYYCELKIDGVAIELVYSKGILKVGATRGDGKVGENITQNLKTISAIPLKILEKKEIVRNMKKFNLIDIAENIEKNGLPEEIIVRGEVFINKSDFEKLKKEQEKKGEKAYANPRNFVAGSIRQLNPKITAKRNLDSFIYSLITDLGQKTHEQEHNILKALGFKINKNNKSAKNLKEVFQFRNYWDKKRETLSYQIDGVVVILNSERDFKKAGVVGKAPRAAMAYKFSPIETTTKLLDIKLQVGRTGAITPVAILKPVEIGGVVVSRATLHNFDEINRLNLKIKDTVIIRRAGDVIPKITGNLPNLRTGKEKEISIPKYCPYCNSPIEKKKDEVVYKCSNRKCFAVQRESIYHFVSKSAFDIVGLGPRIIDKLLDNNLIISPSDIFNLKKEDIKELEGFREKSAQNIISSIEKRKRISLPRFIFSLGIPLIGEETAIDLSNKLFFQSKKPQDLLKKIEKIQSEDLEKIQDIGSKTAKEIMEWFKEKRNKKLINDLDKIGIKFEKLKIKKQIKKLKDKKFIFTGSLQSLSREKAKERIRELGGDVSSSISKNIDFVISGSKVGSKFEKSKKLGLKILNEEEFLKIIEE